MAEIQVWACGKETCKEEGPHFLVTVSTILSLAIWPHMPARTLDSSVLAGGCGAGGGEAGPQKVARGFCMTVVVARAGVGRQEG